MIDWKAGLATAALTIAAVAGCAVPARAASDRPLVITQTQADRGLLAPYAHMRDGVGYLYTSYVFDSLIGQDATGAPAPELARAWSLSDDGLTAEIELDPRARWHDGVPVTARDVAFTIGYMAAHPYPFASVANIAGADVVSDERIRLTLRHRDAGLFSGTLLAMPILPEHIYAGQEAPERFATPEAAIGSGPYELVDYDKAQGRYTLKANPDYYRGAPKFDALMIASMAPDAAIEALRAGEIDVVSDLPADRLDALAGGGAEVVADLSGHTSRIGFNHAGMFGDRALRQALAQALDRRAVLAIAAPKGAAVVAETGYFQAGSPWHSGEPDPAYPHDPAAAAALLRGAGWKEEASGRWSRGGVPVTLRLIADQSQTRVAQVVADQLEAFGLGVDLRMMDRASLLAVPEGGDYDLLISSTSTTGDPGDIIRRVAGGAGNSDRYHGDGRIAAALLAAQAAPTPAERRAHLGEFQHLYAEELPALMLLNPVMAIVHDGKIAPRFMPGGALIGIPTALDKSVFLNP